MSRIQAGDLYLECESHGDLTDKTQDVIVLVRGLGTQLIEWSPVFIAALRALQLNVVVFDNRDVGLSQGFEAAGIPDLSKVARKEAAAPYTASDMAADVIALMDALSIDKAHLFGISMGGMIAQLCAHEFPERVLSMMSVMSSSSRKGLPPASPRAQEAMAAQPDPAGGRQAVIDLNAENMVVCGSPDYPESLADRLKMAASAHDRAYRPSGVSRQIAAIVASGDRSEKLKLIDVPTTVIHGTHDALIPIACGRDTADLIPNAKFVAVEGMGHNIPSTLAPKMADIVAMHLRQLAS